MEGTSLIMYGERMVNDLFDGSEGFGIDGGIKDSMLVVVLDCIARC